jgi:hypothetical protein
LQILQEYPAAVKPENYCYHTMYFYIPTLKQLASGLNVIIYSVTSEKRTPMGLVKKFGFQRFPEFRGL